MFTKDSQTTKVRSIQQQVKVNFAYGVHFTRGLFKLDNCLLSEIVGATDKPKSIVVAIDSGVLEQHPQLINQIEAYTNHFSDKLNLVAKPIIVPGGEAAKNDPLLINKIQIIAEQVGLCRHSYILAIGGGAVVDMVGYAAATAHRGIRLIRIPTTVLAQNDSGVGVKNGVNAFGKKNFLGTFAPPAAVLNDFDFLTTLSESRLAWRNCRSGQGSFNKRSELL